MLLVLVQAKVKVKHRVLVIVLGSVPLANVVQLLHQSIQVAVAALVVGDPVHDAPFPLAASLPFSCPIPLATFASLVQSSRVSPPPFAVPFEVEAIGSACGLYCGTNAS